MPSPMDAWGRMKADFGPKVAISLPPLAAGMAMEKSSSGDGSGAEDHPSSPLAVTIKKLNKEYHTDRCALDIWGSV